MNLLATASQLMRSHGFAYERFEALFHVRTLTLLETANVPNPRDPSTLTPDVQAAVQRGRDAIVKARTLLRDTPTDDPSDS